MIGICLKINGTAYTKSMSGFWRQETPFHEFIVGKWRNIKETKEEALLNSFIWSSPARAIGELERIKNVLSHQFIL